MDKSNDELWIIPFHMFWRLEPSDKRDSTLEEH